MNIELTSKFKNYVKEKNINNISIKYGKSCGSWSGSFRVPLVLKEKPDDTINYNKFVINSINIYVHKSVKVIDDNTLTLTITGFFIFKNITVKGMDLALF